MHSIRIIGAGSIGNHLANAARAFGWRVTLTDIDPAALARTRDSIYPQRYGKWDDEIVLKDSRAAMAEPADVVFIGTPPDSHIALANAVLDEVTPSVLLIEKPLAGPDLAGCAALLARLRTKGVFGAVGYNHTLGKNTVLADSLLAQGGIGPVATISARTREQWGGIFRAHPWLSGPSDSYLGFAALGGGATGEHSHGINMWQHFANLIGAGRVTEVTAVLDMVHEEGCDYDRLSYAVLKTENGLIGDVIQDVVTEPADKSCRIQGQNGYIDWRVNHSPGHDAVVLGIGADRKETLIAKTRPDDFKAEIAHLEDVIAGKVRNSPIALERGLDTMMVIAAIFKSHQSARRVHIDWSKGYVTDAIR